MSPIQSASGAPVFRAIAALFVIGRDLLGRLGAPLARPVFPPRPSAAAPRPCRTQTPEQRIARALEWLAALAATLAGDRTWLRVPTYILPNVLYRYPSLTADLREQIGLPALPPRTEAQTAAARRWYMKKVFATQPTAKIAARLARRLGIAKTAAAWPTDLLAITQTPAAYAKRPSPSPSWGGKGWGAATQTQTPPENPDKPPATATGPP